MTVQLRSETNWLRNKNYTTTGSPLDPPLLHWAYGVYNHGWTLQHSDTSCCTVIIVDFDCMIVLMDLLLWCKALAAGCVATLSREFSAVSSVWFNRSTLSLNKLNNLIIDICFAGEEMPQKSGRGGPKNVENLAAIAVLMQINVSQWHYLSTFTWFLLCALTQWVSLITSSPIDKDCWVLSFIFCELKACWFKFLV